MAVSTPISGGTEPTKASYRRAVRPNLREATLRSGGAAAVAHSVLTATAVSRLSRRTLERGTRGSEAYASTAVRLL